MRFDPRMVVTGRTGKAGRWVVADLRGHGHEVLNVDTRHDGSPRGQCLVADLDYGQAAQAVAGADAVVHLAAIPAREIGPAAETFRVNALSTNNVFAAAVAADVHRVAWASSETVLGLRSTSHRRSPRSTRLYLTADAARHGFDAAVPEEIRISVSGRGERI